ncbi:hypothetical protein I7I53_00385 [Histoplasma capsulatum var. duboisii H88]|uniref:Uncharacterized protein n=1 Tax=Ajellomyces capsulatus (strain H88) TaxID=544711 RepID=A0A8A1LJQ5_AJEC8|nr:hypothetical protein I7I53_00385 [Histoplasma capsulatum var. duboisii H88]
MSSTLLWLSSAGKYPTIRERLKGIIPSCPRLHATTSFFPLAAMTDPVYRRQRSVSHRSDPLVWSSSVRPKSP